MHIFEYSEITVSIPSDIVDMLIEIEGIRAFDPIRVKVYRKELEEARQACLEEDVAATSSLEGLDTARVPELLSGAEPLDDDEAVIQGCIRALEEILDEPSRLDVDERSILHLHKTITNGTTRRESRFRYRETQESDSSHTRAIRSLPSDEVRPAVNQMSESYAMANQVGVRPILLAPCVVLDFLNIQPFTEANWRISRMLLHALLLDGGLEALRYVPFETLIADDPDEYYDAVSESSTGWRNNTNDPFDFVRYVTGIVLDCYREFGTRYPLDGGGRVDGRGRIVSVLESEHGRELSKTEICRRLPDMSRRTADKLLTGLCQEGRITKTGSFKDARYKK